MSTERPNAAPAEGDASAGPGDTRTLTPMQELQPGDAYLDGPYLVFTAQYHLRRGYCCHSGCRHCPYREAEDTGL